MFFRLPLVALLLQCVTSYKMYQDYIPNGAAGPFPCKSGQVWEGVGHINDQGTGPRNPFGVDFAASNHNWTEVCPRDSDGDGLTNGEELGDPNCVWTRAAKPNRTDNLSHPGICDPWDSPSCMKKPVISPKYSTQQEWLEDSCKSGEFQCPALSEPEIQNLTLRLAPNTSVPAKETTYICQMFDLRQMGVANDTDFHIVAVTPIIDNRNVLHHMVLSGCTDDTPVTSEPFECGMTASDSCMEFLHVWTVGLSGECYHPQAGVKIGLNGVKIVAIQLHWNNPAESSQLKDSSGLLVHYTPKLRPYDAGVLTVGSALFYLPPKQQHLNVISTCAGTCTNSLFTAPINVTSVWNHMHYAGNDMNIEVFRNGQHQIYLTNDKAYSYDSPQVYQYPEPFVLQPGDEVRTICGFTTATRNKTTFYGEATNDEMCFGFVTYYPRQNVKQPFCVDQLEVSYCSPLSWDKCPNPYAFNQQISETNVFKEVKKNCMVLAPCLSECVDTIVKYMKTEPCMQGDIWEYEQYMLSSKGNTNGIEFLSRLASCKVEVHLALNPSSAQALDDGDSAVETTASVILLVISLVVAQV